MRIKDLFAKPIDRPINGVIKADQAVYHDPQRPSHLVLPVIPR